MSAKARQHELRVAHAQSETIRALQKMCLDAPDETKGRQVPDASKIDESGTPKEKSTVKTNLDV